ncbi:MAG: flippase-like domain-containing protein [Williamsia sp.]|nr:flippase-like domain-containing protein [Williamsia sp.]
MTWSSKNIKLLRYFIGPVLFSWLSYSIYLQVKEQTNLSASLNSFGNILNDNRSWKLWLVLLLMMVNWGVEAKKLQVVLSPVEEMRWRRSLKAVLTGLAFSISTPNRVGEYPGKVLWVQPGNRIKALSLIIAGNLSQLIITLIMGLGALIFLLYAQDAATMALWAGSYFPYLRAGIWVAGGLLIIAGVTYFRLQHVIDIGGRFAWVRKITAHAAVLKEMDNSLLVRIGGLSLLRYLIFASQYILLLQAMQVDIPLWQAFWLIGGLFLILSLVPTIAFAELGIRGQLSLALFGLYSSNSFGIIAASIGIWVINLVIPAMIGSLFILRIKTFQNR